MEDKRDKIKEIFKTTLNIEDGVDIEKLQYRDSGWDSVAHMALIAEIEGQFDIMVETDDLIGMSSFEKAIELVEKYTK